MTGVQTCALPILKVMDLDICNNENIEVMNDGEDIVALLTTATKVEVVEEVVEEVDLLRKLY